MGDCVPFPGIRQSIANFQFVVFDAPPPRRIHPGIHPPPQAHRPPVPGPLQSHPDPRQQMYLGDDHFIDRMQKHAALDAQSANRLGVRRKAGVNGFYQGGHTQIAIALVFGVSSSTVSRVIKEFEIGE